MSPVIPSSEVERVLRVTIGNEILNSAPVVIELDPDRVKEHSSVEHCVVGGIWVYTLWCGSQVVLLRSIRCIIITDLVTKCGHVIHYSLEVKVEAVNYRIAERTLHTLVGWHRAKRVPDQLCASNCSGLAAEAALVVGSSSD